MHGILFALEEMTTVFAMLRLRILFKWQEVNASDKKSVLTLGMWGKSLPTKFAYSLL